MAERVPSGWQELRHSQLAAGEPVRSWWSNFKLKAPLRLPTYRWPNCGYLECIRMGLRSYGEKRLNERLCSIGLGAENADHRAHLFRR